jgi:hypothetical protein
VWGVNFVAKADALPILKGLALSEWSAALTSICVVIAQQRQHRIVTETHSKRQRSLYMRLYRERDLPDVVGRGLSVLRRFGADTRYVLIVSLLIALGITLATTVAVLLS